MSLPQLKAIGFLFVFSIFGLEQAWSGDSKFVEADCVCTQYVKTAIGYSSIVVNKSSTQIPINETNFNKVKSQLNLRNNDAGSWQHWDTNYSIFQHAEALRSVNQLCKDEERFGYVGCSLFIKGNHLK